MKKSILLGSLFLFSNALAQLSGVIDDHYLANAAEADEIRAKLFKKFNDFVSRGQQEEIDRRDVTEVYVIAAEGADAFITERNNYYKWKLLREYYFDFEIDSSGATRGLNLDYDPNTNIGRSFPAVFALWYSKPYNTLSAYRDIFIAAAKAVAGNTYLELSNKSDTLYENIPGWDFSYQYRSGINTFILKSHMLLIHDVAFNVFFLTTKTDYDDFLSKVWYALILSSLDFNAGTLVVNERKTFENLRAFLLLPNYPNPFNASTVIPYKVEKRAMVSLDILDLNGRLIERLFNKMHEPGEYQIKWDSNKSSGIYFYKISDGVRSLSQRMILIK